VKATVSLNGPSLEARTSRWPHARGFAFAAWIGILSTLLALLFIGVTALTIGIWLTEPGYSETNPVVDLGFFALGGLLIGIGVASQLRSPERHISGLHQALIGLVSLAAAGYLGGRVEPLWGALALIVAVAIAIALHPAPRRLIQRGDGVSLPLVALSLAAALPALTYANHMLTLAGQAGPSCFMGQCARGDRFAEVAALAIALVLVTALASARTGGWPMSATSAGVAATMLGLVMVALPAVPGSAGAAWGMLTAAWGVLVLATTAWQARQPGRTGHLEGGRLA
jgi:hypothetical protein